MDSDALAGHFRAGRFEEAAALLSSYTVPHVTERETEFVVHDLAADAGQVLCGTFEPIGPQVMIDLDSAFSIVGTSRGALFLYVGQPDVAGECLYDSGGKPHAGVQMHPMASICGDSPWGDTTSRRIVVDVDPAKPVTWQVLAGIIGPSAITPVSCPSQIAITPDGATAFVTSPDNGTVTPIALGRPLYSYDRIRRPDDVGEAPVATGAGATFVAADNAHVVVTNVDDPASSVTVIDAITREVLHQVALPGALGVAVTPDGAHAVVGTATGTVAWINLSDGSLRSLHVPDAGRLRGVAVTLDGTAAFVVDTDNGATYRIALPSLAVEGAIEVGEKPWVVRVSPDGHIWVMGRNDDTNGRLRRIDPGTNTVEDEIEMPFARPNDFALVPIDEQTDDVVRTAWTVYDDGYSELYIAGFFKGQPHSWHTGAFPEDKAGPSGIAVNDYGEIWVVRPSADLVFKWPGGRFKIRPGIFFGEYCTVSVYGAR